MRVKRFTAPNVASAVLLVKRSLGPQAVILSTERRPDGQVEISAAVDPEPQAENARTATAAPAGSDGDRADAADGPILEKLTRQVKGLKDMLARHMVAGEAAGGFSDRPEVEPFYRHLMSQEVDAAIVGRLLEDLSPLGGHGISPRLAIRLKKMFKVADPLRVGRGGPRVWALVGPTGVGKTTTVAKLAATFSLRYRLKVGLITVDTFRIAAPEQLKVYGRIMELPTLVASGRDELAEALDEMSELDLVLVDTVGRSPNDTGNIEELAGVLAGAPDLVCHLVLACPTRDADQMRAWEAYSRFSPASLIYTKLDESSTYGSMLNQVVRTGLPVSYICYGQKVPEDLAEADREALARRLMPDRRGAA